MISRIVHTSLDDIRFESFVLGLNAIALVTCSPEKYFICNFLSDGFAFLVSYSIYLDPTSEVFTGSLNPATSEVFTDGLNPAHVPF